jgi:ABC-type Fe3+ transport system substrate-binding protein
LAEEPTAEQLVEELRKAKVSDLLVHTTSMIASLGFAKLDVETRDLEQARLAIEALKALSPLLPADSGRDVDGVVAALQLAYADAVKTAP